MIVRSRQASYLSGRQVFCAELSPSSEPTHACTAGPAGWHTSAVAWPPQPAAPHTWGPDVLLPPLLPFRGLPPHLQRQLYRPQGAEIRLTGQLHPLARPDSQLTGKQPYLRGVIFQVMSPEFCATIWIINARRNNDYMQNLRVLG